MHLRKDPIPEIQRIPLEQMVLRIKILPLFKSFKVLKVLKSLIEPPQVEAMDSAIVRLKGVGALDAQCDLTPLGYHLASLPVDVRIGKLMLFGCVFRCMDSALTIAAALSYRSPFLSPFGKREEAMKRKKEFAGNIYNKRRKRNTDFTQIYFSLVRNSDHLAILRAYQSWHDLTNERGNRAGYNYAQERFLSQKTLHMLVSMKHQYLELLSSIGFGPRGINMRGLNRMARNGGDAVVTATGNALFLPRFLIRL